MPAAIDFIFFDAGGGHRAAATALKSVIDRQQRPWPVRLVNLQELLDPIDILRKLTGLRVQDAYTLLLIRGWTLGAGQLLHLLHAGIRIYHRSQVRILKEFWAQQPPEMVVSLVPDFNRALCEAFQAARPGAPFVTVLTDLADYPPHFWIENQDQYVICGTRRAIGQAREIGVPPEKVLRVSGMILRPQFYEPVEADREAERERLGLKAGVPTGLVLFGAQGSKVTVDIVRRLQRVKRELQLIVICGRNEKLAQRLRSMPSRFPVFVEGFTSEIPYYMRLSDFLIGKPGPGSISEAVQMDLPLIVESNAWTLPQERYDTEWVLEKGVGVVVSSFREIASAVERLLDAETLERCRAAAAAIDNRAVFDIPDILEKLLDNRAGSQ